MRTSRTVAPMPFGRSSKSRAPRRTKAASSSLKRAAVPTSLIARCTGWCPPTAWSAETSTATSRSRW